jgi:hypothetical protein
MKKNIAYGIALAVTLMATSCDQNKTETAATDNEVVTTTAPVTETTIDNPNVATTTTEQTAVANPNAPVMSFAKTEYDFGKIKQGEVVSHTFEFTNTGKQPLIIESASASCGCTAPDWTKTPVAPGEKGTVKVEFNSTGKFGQQAPMVTIRANTEPNIVRVSMKGEVEATNTIPTAGADGPVKRN